MVLIGRRGVVSDLDLLLFDVSIRAAVLRKLGSHRLIPPTHHYPCVYDQAKKDKRKLNYIDGSKMEEKMFTTDADRF